MSTCRQPALGPVLNSCWQFNLRYWCYTPQWWSCFLPAHIAMNLSLISGLKSAESDVSFLVGKFHTYFTSQKFLIIWKIDFWSNLDFVPLSDCQEVWRALILRFVLGRQWKFFMRPSLVSGAQSAASNFDLSMLKSWMTLVGTYRSFFWFSNGIDCVKLTVFF